MSVKMNETRFGQGEGEHGVACGNRFSLSCVLCVALVVLADVFFWKQPQGWTVGCYGLLLMGAIVLSAGRLPRDRPAVVIAAALVFLFLSCFEEPNRLTVALGLLGLGTLALAAREGWSASSVVWIKRWGLLLGAGWLALFRDVRAYSRSRQAEGSGRRSGLRFLRNWSLAAVLGGVFVGLLAAANPIIANWLKDAWRIFTDVFDRLPSAWRAAIWLLVGVCVWALLRYQSGVGGRPRDARSESVAAADGLLSADAIVRCLALFNLIFAVQTVLDIHYLYGGARLPEAMTYARYAHRGAYPLVATALLAAAFVLAAFREGQHGEGMRWARRLVYAWLAQNVFLVVSAAWRLCLYVEAYTLTRLRVAAAIWMLLVICGLAWILVRIVTARSNVWLVNVNVLTALVVLYVCAFANFDGFISRFNVTHCAEIGGEGPVIDLRYLEGLGPDTLPALLWLAERLGDSPKGTDVLETADRLTEDLHHDLRNWRGWTLRRRRLARLVSSERERGLSEGPD